MTDLDTLRVRNGTVWMQIKYLLLGSAVLFLVNIYFGFDNALTEGDLPRWQLLIHLHAGSIGWITLSVIAMAVWVFSGDRELSNSYVSRVKTLTWLVILAFGGYIISFGLAFSQGIFILLPIFGTLSALIIWVAAIFAITQLRRSEVKSEPQLMVTAGLLIASLGALMGVLLGLENALGTFFIPGADRIGSHAGVMDSYLLLASSTIVSWFLRRNGGERYSRGALVQAILFTLAPIAVWLGLLANAEQLAGLSAPLIIVGIILFSVRNGRGVLKLNPLRKGPAGWVFFGAIWAVIWAVLFAYLITIFLSQGPEAVSPGFIVFFTHAAFIGMMTNLILGVDSVRSHGAQHVLSWAEPTALWLMNVGLVLFVALKFASDTRLGAIVMGVGVLLGVGTMIVRLLSKEEEEVAMATGD